MKWKVNTEDSAVAVAVPSTSSIHREATVTAGEQTFRLSYHSPSRTVVITDTATGLEQMVAITQFTPDPNPRWGTLKPLLAGTILGNDFAFDGELQLDAPGQDHRRVMAKNAVKQVDSPMTGKVIKVLAEEGAQVDSKTAVVVVEAMKMENRIVAGADGIVKGLKVEEGQAIKVGDPLFSVHPIAKD